MVFGYIFGRRNDSMYYWNISVFEIDPIGFKEGLSWDDYRIFASTIGNINTYTSYVALISGMSVVLFVNENTFYRKVWYTFALLYHCLH